MFVIIILYTMLSLVPYGDSSDDSSSDSESASDNAVKVTIVGN